ncbi:MAG TPA: MFS transporter [Chloroflexota bacterium]|nr:MFS transporter [Chloroflexota bacterium]
MAAVAEAVPIGGTAAHISDEQLRSIRRRTAGLLFTSQIFGSGGTTAALTVATILAASILGSSTWAGLPNSVRTLGAALFAIPLSAFMVRTGRRKGLLLGYAVGTVGGALCVISAVASNYPLLLIGSAVFGAGYAANLLSRYASADVTPASQRGKAISFVVWGATLGAILGPGLVGPAGRWAEDLGLPPLAGAFGLAMATFGVAALLIFVFLRPDPLHVSRQIAAQTPARGDAAPPRSLTELLRIPGVQVAFITLMTSHMVMIGIMSMTPVYLHDHGHGLATVGFVISGHVTGMYVFSPVTGWLSDKLGRHTVIFLSALTFIVAALLDALSPASSGLLVGVGMFLIGLGWNLGFVSGSALLTDSVTIAERPKVQGAADMWMGVAAALGSLASGPILETHGYGTLNVWVALLVVFPLAAVFFRQVRPQPIPVRS